MNTKINKTNTKQNNHAELMNMAAKAAIVIAGILVLIKLFAWYETESSSILASLVDSIMDNMASILNFFAIRYALTPADKEHRFGHGKAESIAGLFQAAFIFGSAIFLILHSIKRITSPIEIEETSLGMSVMIISTVLTLGLVIFQRYVVKQTASTAIAADSLHYVSDLLTNVAIIIALYFASIGIVGIDSSLAIVIAILIMWSSYHVAKTAINNLLDTELGEDIQRKIEKIVINHENVYGMHDLRTRQSGQTKFIQFHVELDDDLTLYRAHQIADEIEADILTVFPQSDIIIHIDPQSLTAK